MKNQKTELLKEELFKQQNRLKKIADAFPWENDEAYLNWLVSTYEYAKNSTRILAHAAASFSEDKTTFSNRFIAHAAEEKGHEKLLENDAKQMGKSIRAIPSLPGAKSFHYSLYYWLTKGNPIGIFGWVMVLECFAVKNVPGIYERCKKAHGSKVVSFLKVHAEEDEDHFEKAIQTLDSLSDEDIDTLRDAINFYSEEYGNLYLEIQQNMKNKFEHRITA